MDHSALHSHFVELLKLDKDQAYSILDFGCGAGDLLARLRDEVGPDSRLLGMDADEKSIAWAKHRFDEIVFEHEKFVDNFEYPDNSFDVVVSVDTLECIPDKVTLLREIARVLKPNGRLLIAHWDWDTQVYNSKHKDIVRRVVNSFADWQQGWMDACDGQMGRKLWGLLQGSRLFDGRMHSYTLLETEFLAGNYGFDRFQDVGELVSKDEFPKDDYERLKTDLTTLHERGEYFYSLNSYIYIGTRI